MWLRSYFYLLAGSKFSFRIYWTDAFIYTLQFYTKDFSLTVGN